MQAFQPVLLGLAQLLSKDGLFGEVDLDELLLASHRFVRILIPTIPTLLAKPHFETDAKQVLVIFCPGAVSHVDTFDYKPDLTKYHGQKPPGMPAVTFEGPFRKYRQTILGIQATR